MRRRQHLDIVSAHFLIITFCSSPDRLADEKDFLRQEIENEKKDVVDRLKRENQMLRDQLESSRSGLKLHIDDNASDTNKKMNELACKLSKMMKDSDLSMRDLTTKLSSETSNLKSLISKPLSVYFNAYRTEDYVDGGEDYLTFQGIRVTYACYVGC